MARPPIIGIDGSRLAVGERTGTETYTYHLLRELASLESPEPIRVYLNSSSPPEGFPAQFEPIPISFPRLWTHARLSWEMLRRPTAVLFVPAHVIPLWHPRSVVTVHDLGYLHESESHPAAQRRMLDWTTRWSCRAATKIIAISEDTKADLIAHYEVADSKIRVIHHGISESFRRAAEDEIARVKRKFGLPERYVLFVGTVQPRKNIERIAVAMRRVQEYGFSHKLIVAGKSGWLSDKVEEDIEAAGNSELVYRIGYVPDSDMPALYSGADIFCFPSLYEGFGLPVLEAMATGTPVVTSNRSALPEVAGDAARLVDPSSVDEIADALIHVLSNESERARLIRAGEARAKQFSWQACAQTTLDLLIEVRDCNLDES